MDTFLSSTVTVTNYQDYVANQQANKIVVFVKQRFSERYIEPMNVDRNKKNGFTIMAVSCLMIEALESFRQGWKDSNRRSQLAFCNFFDRNENFLFIRGHSQEFYRSVRCGILHQGETTSGWHIRRNGKVFDEASKTINATLFHEQVEKSLIGYCSQLERSDWDSDIWENLRKKMNAVCKNCEP